MASGGWVRVHHGTYLAAAAAATPQGRLAAGLLAAGPAAVLSHTSAAVLLGGALLRGEEHVHVVVPASRRVAVAGLCVHQVDLPLVDVTVAAGLRSTSPLRTAVDVARLLPRDPAVVVLDSLLALGVVRMPALQTAAEAAKGRGAAQARAVVALAQPGGESPFETLVRLLLVDAGIGPIRTQVVIRDELGRYVVRADMLLDKLVLMCDGAAYHGDRKGFLRDRQVDEELRRLGYTVMRLVWPDLRSPPRLMARVATARSRPAAA